MIFKYKFRNYLTYAIGEIVLVVVGILIALQINSWSEENRNKKLEQDYYCRLKEDLQQDELFLKQLITENEDRLNKSNELLQLLQQLHPNREDVILRMRGATTKTTFTFKPSQAAYEDIKSSGNLNILKDIHLKTELINYYSTMVGLADVVDVNSDASVAMYYRLDKDFVDIGWPDLPTLISAIDTSRVDVKQLQSVNFPSASLLKALTSEAIFYLGTNGRKRELYKTMADEIQKMKNSLVSKCPN